MGRARLCVGAKLPVSRMARQWRQSLLHSPRFMHPLNIYNTLAREKQPFVPIEPGRVRMYVCGMTIYDYCHVGHARFMMAFDVAYRWLKTLGYEVTYVRNITDIDDKIIKRALERNIPIRQLTDEMTVIMHEDVAALGISV